MNRKLIQYGLNGYKLKGNKRNKMNVWGNLKMEMMLILVGFIGMFIYMNGNFKPLKKRVQNMEKLFEDKIENDVTILYSITKNLDKIPSLKDNKYSTEERYEKVREMINDIAIQGLTNSANFKDTIKDMRKDIDMLLKSNEINVYNIKLLEEKVNILESENKKLISENKKLNKSIDLLERTLQISEKRRYAIEQIKANNKVIDFENVKSN